MTSSLILNDLGGDFKEILDLNSDLNLNLNYLEKYKDTTMFYIKHNVSSKEYEMHKHVYELNIVNTPKIIYYDKANKIMILEKIDNLSISDCYGENHKKIDEDVFCKIRGMIKALYEHNIIYPDITGYNFIEYGDAIWIIDFEHAYFRNKVNKPNLFVNRFLKGANKWNPAFK
jgi:tRNA A-37 threonylcarbamoyl transferase component Bud32